MMSTVREAVSPSQSHSNLGCDLPQRGRDDGVRGGEPGGEVLTQGDEKDDEEIVEFQEEDTEPWNVPPTPEAPTQEEIDRHQVDHIP